MNGEEHKALITAPPREKPSPPPFSVVQIMPAALNVNEAVMVRVGFMDYASQRAKALFVLRIGRAKFYIYKNKECENLEYKAKI